MGTQPYYAFSCRYWIDCCTHGYCHLWAMANDGMTNINRCTLGQMLFIEANPDTISHWKAHAAIYSTFTEFNPDKKEEFTNMLKIGQKELPKYTYWPKKSENSASIENHSYRNDIVEYVTAGIKVQGGKWKMPKYEFMKKDGRWDLVKWFYQDLVHYGFMFDSEIVETFSPAPHRKGMALRTYVMDLYEKRISTPDAQCDKELKVENIPHAVMDYEDCIIGDYLIYECGPGKLKVMQITAKGTTFLHATGNPGETAMWLKDKLDEKLHTGQIVVVAEEHLPDQFRRILDATRTSVG